MTLPCTQMVPIHLHVDAFNILCLRPLTMAWYVSWTAARQVNPN